MLGASSAQEWMQISQSLDKHRNCRSSQGEQHYGKWTIFMDHLCCETMEPEETVWIPDFFLHFSRPGRPKKTSTLWMPRVDFSDKNSSGWGDGDEICTCWIQVFYPAQWHFDGEGSGAKLRLHKSMSQLSMISSWWDPMRLCDLSMASYGGVYWWSAAKWPCRHSGGYFQAKDGSKAADWELPVRIGKTDSALTAKKVGEICINSPVEKSRVQWSTIFQDTSST